MLLDVRSLFDAELRKIEPNTDRLRFLLQHQRKDLCINRLSMEIVQAEFSLGKRFQKRHMDMMVSNVARMFADSAIRHRNEQNLSQAEKNRLDVKPKTEESILEELSDAGCEIIKTAEIVDCTTENKKGH